MRARASGEAVVDGARHSIVAITGYEAINAACGTTHLASRTERVVGLVRAAAAGLVAGVVIALYSVIAVALGDYAAERRVAPVVDRAPSAVVAGGVDRHVCARSIPTARVSRASNVVVAVCGRGAMRFVNSSVELSFVSWIKWCGSSTLEQQ